MGNTWAIEVWKRVEWCNNEYGYECLWSGESWIGALVNLVKAKRKGYGCVTLHWR